MKKRIFAICLIAALLTACKAEHTHNYTQQVTKATCLAKGYTTYSCQCGDTYEDDATAIDKGNHIDEDNDLYCDRCNAYVIVELDFYSVNDLHGAFLDTETHPGVDEFTTYMKEKFADTSSYEVLLSAGDMWQGSVESSSNKGALMTRWMSELGFVSMTLGNHEFDWGSAYIKENSTIAQFPFLGINIREYGVQPDYCKSSIVVERGGVKIGVIGAMGNHLDSISGEFTENLEFITGRELTQLVQEESTRLRQEEGCDLIIYVIHNDNNGYDATLSDGYVDLVFEGHTHKSYVETDRHGVVHIQSGSYNEGISFVNIAYNLIEDTFVVEEKKNISANEYGDEAIADDPLVTDLFKEHFPDENPYETVLGVTGSDIMANVICQEIANQYLAFGKENWSEYDIVLGGGRLKLRDPNRLYAGDITYAKLFTLMPFDNSIVLGEISGAKLKSKFLNNNSFYITKNEEMPTIEDSETYYIIVDTYTAYDEANGITVVDRYDNYYSRDMIADFVKTGAWNS